VIDTDVHGDHGTDWHRIDSATSSDRMPPRYQGSTKSRPLRPSPSWSSITGNRDILENVIENLIAKEWGCVAQTHPAAAETINAIVQHAQIQADLTIATASVLQNTAMDVHALRNLEQATRTTGVSFDAYWQLAGDVTWVYAPNQLSFIAPRGTSSHLDVEQRTRHDDAMSDLLRRSGLREDATSHGEAIELASRCLTKVPDGQSHQIILTVICARNRGPALINELICHCLYTWSRHPDKYTTVLRGNVRAVRTAVRRFNANRIAIDAAPAGSRYAVMTAQARRACTRLYERTVGSLVRCAINGPAYAGDGHWRYRKAETCRYSKFFIPAGGTLQQETQVVVQRIRRQVFNLESTVETQLRTRTMVKLHFLTEQQLYAAILTAKDMSGWSERYAMCQASMTFAVGEVRYTNGKYYLLDRERAYPIRLRAPTVVRVAPIGKRQHYLLPRRGVRLTVRPTPHDTHLIPRYVRKMLQEALAAGQLDNRSELHTCPTNYRFIVQAFESEHLYNRPLKYQGGNYRPYNGEVHPSTGLYQLVVLETRFAGHVVTHGYQNRDRAPHCLRVMEVYVGHQTDWTITTYEPMNGPKSFGLNYRKHKRYCHRRIVKREELLFVHRLT
jgi:hypothetical protein